MRASLLLAAIAFVWSQSAWAASLPVQLTVAGPPELPGPSASLFATPYYSCTRNLYVAITGNDTTGNGTSGNPWGTLSKANASAPSAGTCINVAPGTYSSGVQLTYGGNAATSTGYVVYRCMQLDACKITDPNKGFKIAASGTVNYVMIDGFELAASSYNAYGVGISVNLASGNTSTNSAHHIWATNNIIRGYGQSGIDWAHTDYGRVIHNLSYANSHVTCDAQGSGITLVVSTTPVGYTRTAQDDAFGTFNQIVSWNVSHDNILTACGTASSPYNTDGNGIILDDMSNDGVTATAIQYIGGTLIANNIAYANGGGGIATNRVGTSVVIANNTTWSNFLDPFNNGSYRPEIGFQGVINGLMINNVVWSVPATSNADPRCHGSTALNGSCPLQSNAALGGGNAATSSGTLLASGNIFANNVTYGGSPIYGGVQGNAMFDGDAGVFSCALNKCNTNPMLTNTTSLNFAPQSGSPTIGYGKQQTYLPPSAGDVGACSHSLTQCP